MNLRTPKKKLVPPPPARKSRADARRNRERILEVAKEIFTRDGAAASLDDIARQAGIPSAQADWQNRASLTAHRDRVTSAVGSPYRPQNAQSVA